MTDFKPDYTSKQLKDMNVYREVYGDGKKFPRLASLKSWPAHWIHKDDPKGWLEWYQKYEGGRVHEDDERQKKRWSNFKARHGGPAFQQNPTPRRAFALIHWGIDPLKIVPAAKKKNLASEMEAYRMRKQGSFVPLLLTGLT